VISDVKRLLAAGALAALSCFGAGAALAAPTGAGAIRVTISSPTHHPKVNVGWPVTITVTNAAGKSVAGTLTMDVLAEGMTYPIDNGAVYHFVGSWHERAGNLITFPAYSRGFTLTFEVTVKALGRTVRKRFAIDAVG